MIAKLRNLIKRVTSTKPANDSGVFQYAQITYMGRTQNAQVWHDYGFSSSPPVQSMGITVSPQGREGDRMTFLCHPKYRYRDLKPGETVVGNFVIEATLYFDEKGRGVLTLPDDLIISCNNMTATVRGDLTVDVAGSSTMSATDWTFHGPVTMQDGLAVKKFLTNNNVDVGSEHKHHSGSYKDSNGGNVTGQSGTPVS